MKTNWSVQLAKTIEESPIPDGATFTVTRKLNGVRATYYDGKLIGRNGTEYTGLDHILNELAEHTNYVFDGELILADALSLDGGTSDAEAFRIVNGLVRSKDADKTEVSFVIFDCIPRPYFDDGTGNRYSERRLTLDILSKRFGNSRSVRILPALYRGTDQSVIPSLLDQITAKGGEGLMINLDNARYERRRTGNLLKVKKFYTLDLPIIRMEEGKGRNAGTLGAVVVDFDGNEVRVGTGFTADERDELWNNRDQLTGTPVEVKYKEISTNKKGGKSLQFPTFVALRADKMPAAEDEPGQNSITVRLAGLTQDTFTWTHAAAAPKPSPSGEGAPKGAGEVHNPETNAKKEIKVEWCENFIRAVFRKRLPRPDMGIDPDYFWQLAEASGLGRRGTGYTPMIQALENLTDFIEKYDIETKEFLYCAFRLKEYAGTPMRSIALPPITLTVH